MLLCILLLTSILGAASQARDMDGQLFVFPKHSVTDYIILEPGLTSPLDSFTVCLRILMDETRDCGLFSGNNPQKDNDLLFFRNAGSNTYSIYVGAEVKSFKISENALERKHFCATWTSSTGVVQLWFNGKPLPRTVMKKGYYIQKDLKILLGQEQDSYGGSLDEKQSFVGEIGDVHMWDYVLSPEDIQQAMCNNKHLNGNVISWRALRYELKGAVLVEPVQQSVCESRACYCVPSECRAQ